MDEESDSTEKIIRVEYIADICKLLECCNDIDSLDFIRQLLVKTTR